MDHQRARRRTTIGGIVVIAALTSLAASGCSDSQQPSVAAAENESSDGHDSENPELAAANLAAAPYQDMEVATAAGWSSTIDSLGCFENPRVGGMGLHLLNDELLDATLDVGEPEALVYELDADGEVVGLVAHEYIVPVEAWTESDPPELFGRALHQHPTLPLYVLHTWIWKDNPDGVFADWNPRVRPCPDGVAVFGEDSAPADTTTSAPARRPSNGSVPANAI